MLAPSEFVDFEDEGVDEEDVGVADVVIEFTPPSKAAAIDLIFFCAIGPSFLKCDEAMYSFAD